MMFLLVMKLEMDDGTLRGRILCEGTREEMNKAADLLPGAVVASEDTVKAATLHVMTREQWNKLIGAS